MYNGKEAKTFLLKQLLYIRRHTHIYIQKSKFMDIKIYTYKHQSKMQLEFSQAFNWNLNGRNSLHTSFLSHTHPQS